MEEYCQVDANCWLNDGTFGNCVRGRCTCKFFKQVPAEDFLSCIESRDLGESCTTDAECSKVSNAVCKVTCKCGSRFTLSREQDRCLPGIIFLLLLIPYRLVFIFLVATKFHEFCEENEQCSAFLVGSSCQNNSCTCSTGHHGFGSKCVRSAGIGGSCSGIDQCIPDMKYSGSMNCIDGSCQCLPGVIDDVLGCTGSSVRNRATVLILVLSIWRLAW